MPRWRDDAVGRLQVAALTLFVERGYDDVTVAEIAARAELTRRTFFNHFADKREIFFAGAVAFEAGVISQIAGAPVGDAPLDVAVDALTVAGTALTKLAGEHVSTLRALITSTPELHERELAKMDALTDAMTAALRERGSDARTARAAARVAVAAFSDAWDDWALMQSTQSTSSARTTSATSATSAVKATRSTRFATVLRRRVADQRAIHG